MKYVRIKPTIVETIQCFTTPEGIAQIEKFVGNSVKSITILTHRTLRFLHILLYLEMVKE